MKRLTINPVTSSLVAMLAAQYDDQPRLRVQLPGSWWTPRPADGATIVLTRADGSELSASEQSHVRAILAAHRAEPII